MAMLISPQSPPAVRVRRGTSTLETALILPLLLILTFGIIEFGWMFLKVHQINSVTRQAARTAMLPESTNATVTSQINSLMTASGMSTGSYTIAFSPADITTAQTGQNVSVTIQVPYANIGITGGTLNALSQSITGQTVLPTQIQSQVVMTKEGP